MVKITAYLKQDYKKTQIRRYERNIRRYEGKSGKGVAYCFIALSGFVIGLFGGAVIMGLLTGQVVWALIALLFAIFFGWRNYKTDSKTGAPESLRQCLLKYNVNELQRLNNKGVLRHEKEG